MAKISVFDFGTVLATPLGLFEGFSQALGVPQTSIEAAYWRHRAPYDAGQSDLDFWTNVLGDIQELNAEQSASLIPALVDHDVATWSVIRPAAAALLADLQGAGTPRVVLSNAPAVFVERASNFAWASTVDQFFFSGEVQISKPDPRIYAHVEAELGVPPEDLYFIDDLQPNVDAALARGWNAHLWASDEDSRQWLASTGLLPS